MTTLVRDDDGACCGAVARDVRSGRLELFTAKNVILACGGAGQAYYPTTNGLIVTGDGIALAYRHWRAADGHGDGAVPPDDARRERPPDHRGRSRRGRDPPELGGRALHGALRAEQARSRLARRRLAGRADGDPRGTRRRPARRRHLPRHHEGAAQAHPRGAARDRQYRPRLRGRRHHARTDHDPPGPALHHGRGKDRHRRRDVDPGPLRGRRGRVRLGSRRQSPRRELAARHAHLRPPRGRACGETRSGDADAARAPTVSCARRKR